MVYSENNQRALLSKMATGDGHGENSPYFDGWKAYDSDPFHLTMNPHGVIQMGLAENQLSFDLIEKWIGENLEASICTSAGVGEFREKAIFQDYHGLPEFRHAVANFMERVRGNRVKFEPDRIVMSGGATGAHEMIAFCLADPGDAFLVPTPYYLGFDRDLRWSTGVQLLPVICDSSNNFKITKNALEEAYDKAQKSNIKVKGLLVTNPSNPLGTTLDSDTLLNIITFINKKNIHLICDEIYAATTFSQPEFISIAEIITQSPIQCDRDLIHIVLSLSKDLGFPGFRVGILYSYNDNVIISARKMSSFCLVSTQTQHLISKLLLENSFTEHFIHESARRLKARHAAFTRGLARVNITCLKSNAGLYTWMNLKNLLKEDTFEAEMDLWRVIVKDVKLNVSPGASFHCAEPGWFRVCFANVDEETMSVALRRIVTFALQSKEVVKRKCWQDRLGRLSLSSASASARRFEDFVAPMSPHSPLKSPVLVRAT